MLDEIELLLYGERPGAAAESLREARSHALALSATLGDPEESARMAALTFASEALAASWIDRQWGTDDIDRLVGSMADHLHSDGAGRTNLAASCAPCATGTSSTCRPSSAPRPS